MGKTNYTFYESEHYYVFVHGNLIIDKKRFATEIEKRWHQLHEMFSLDKLWSGKYKYILHLDGFNDAKYTDKGSTQRKTIICYFRKEKIDEAQLLPFVHEEMHAILTEGYGKIPTFWAEGFAELATIILEGNGWTPFRVLLLKRALLSIESRYGDAVNMDWIADDKEFYRRRKFGETGYVVSAHFIQFLIDNFGVGIVRHILQWNQSGQYEEIQNWFLVNELLSHWLETLKAFITSFDELNVW